MIQSVQSQQQESVDRPTKGPRGDASSTMQAEERCGFLTGFFLRQECLFIVKKPKRISSGTLASIFTSRTERHWHGFWYWIITFFWIFPPRYGIHQAKLSPLFSSLLVFLFNEWKRKQQLRGLSADIIVLLYDIHPVFIFYHTHLKTETTLVSLTTASDCDGWPWPLFTAPVRRF